MFLLDIAWAFLYQASQEESSIFPSLNTRRCSQPKLKAREFPAAQAHFNTPQ